MTRGASTGNSGETGGASYSNGNGPQGSDPGGAPRMHWWNLA